MTHDEAIAAITNATVICVNAVISKTREGADGHIQTFPVDKQVALDFMNRAMNGFDDAGFQPNIEVSEDGDTVTIGTGWTPPLPENSSHFESNNGNF
jgi:hypothetical protein